MTITLKEIQEVVLDGEHLERCEMEGAPLGVTMPLRKQWKNSCGKQHALTAGDVWQPLMHLQNKAPLHTFVMHVSVCATSKSTHAYALEKNPLKWGFRELQQAARVCSEHEWVLIRWTLIDVYLKVLEPTSGLFVAFFFWLDLNF